MPIILLSVVCYLFAVIYHPSYAATPTPPKTIQLGSFTPPPTKKPVFPTSASTPIPNTEDSPAGTTDPKVFFSQVDPRWRNYPSPNKDQNLGDCGCGETVSAMILSRFIDNSGKYTPPKMWDYYNRYNSSRCGTSLENHTATMQANGLKAAIHVYSNNQVLENYLTSGYTIFLHYKVPTRSYGHYVLLDSVNGNNIKVYDPAYVPAYPQPMPLETGAGIIDYITIKK